MKPNRLKFKRSEQGQAMVEFLFCAITFFFVILGVIQMAMILNAQSLVRYAAYNAARAAIVHGGNQAKMEDAARMSLLPIFPVHGRSDHLRGVYENYVASGLTDQSELLTFLSTKYHWKKITEVKLIRRGGASGTITFDDPTSAGTQGLVTVQVVHLYQMVIPLVNRILFFLHKKKMGPGIYDIPAEWDDFWSDPWDYLFGTPERRTLDRLAAETHKQRLSGGVLHGIEYRIPIVAHYTMRMQSDLGS